MPEPQPLCSRLLFGIMVAMALAGALRAAETPPAPAPADADSGLERLPNGDVRLGAITLHRERRQISFAASVAMAAGPAEVLIATPEGRLHESLLKADARPLHLQVLLYLLDQNNGLRVPVRERATRQGDLLDIDLEWTTADGKTVTAPVEHFIRDNRTGKPMARQGWVFVGTVVREGVPLADLEGNLVLLWSQGNTVLDCPDPQADDDTLFSVNDERKELPAGQAVRVLITPRPAAAATP